jgi:hypothetical protein
MNMNKITLFAAELIIATGLVFTLLSFWRRRLQKAYFIESSNKAYALFLAMQIIALMLIVWLGIDPQSVVYMEDLQPTGSRSGLFWTVYGFQTIGFLLTYIVSVTLSLAVFKSGFKSEKGLNKEISEGNWGPPLIVGCITVFLAVVVGGIVLRPLLLDWVSRNAGFVPLQ